MDDCILRQVKLTPECVKMQTWMAGLVSASKAHCSELCELQSDEQSKVRGAEKR